MAVGDYTFSLTLTLVALLPYPSLFFPRSIPPV